MLVIAVVATMTVVGLVLSTVLAAGESSGLGFGGRVAILEVEGIIADDDTFLEDVRHLRNDGSVRAWVVSINSPGGVVAPSQSLYETLRRVREEDDTPIVAAIGAVGASGGYYVALAADSILAMPGSITGSIGVVMEYPNVSDLMDRVGVEMEIVKAGTQKDLGSPFRDMDEADRAILSALVEDVHDQFIQAVAEARGLSVDQVVPLADGRVLSGRQARAAGLVDRFGNLDDAIAMAGVMGGLGPTPRLVRPPSEEGEWLLDLLLGQGAAGTVRQVVRGLGTRTPGLGPALKYIVH